jgi:hypothetical protein
MTHTWRPEELDTIGNAGELSVAPRHPDGTLRAYTTIWVVRVGDGLFVRSYRGVFGNWFRAATGAGAGRIRAGGLERDVTFEPAAAVDPAGIDGAYRAKYGRSTYVDAMVNPDAVATTLRLIPVEPEL